MSERTMYAVSLWNGSHFLGYIPNSFTFERENAVATAKASDSMFSPSVSEIEPQAQYLFVNSVVDGTSEEQIVILHFKNRSQKNYLMSELHEGFGADNCVVKWKGALEDALHFEIEVGESDA